MFLTTTDSHTSAGAAVARLFWCRAAWTADSAYFDPQQQFKTIEHLHGM